MGWGRAQGNQPLVHTPGSGAGTSRRCHRCQCSSSSKAPKHAGLALTHSRICERYMRMPAGSAADEPPAPLPPAPLLPAPLPPAPLEPAASVGDLWGWHGLSTGARVGTAGVAGDGGPCSLQVLHAAIVAHFQETNGLCIPYCNPQPTVVQGLWPPEKSQFVDQPHPLTTTQVAFCTHEPLPPTHHR